MAFTLCEPQDADFVEIMECAYLAFAEEPFRPLVFPGEPSMEVYQKHAQALIKTRDKDPSLSYRIVRQTSTGKIVTASRWCFDMVGGRFPDNVTVTWVGHPGSEERMWAQHCLGDINSVKKETMSGPHCELALCFTHPAFQHRGVGTLMMEWGLTTAQAMGLQTFVFGMGTAESFYKRWFQCARHVIYRFDRWPNQPTLQYTVFYTSTNEH
ncbi:MAG: hypothetical protein Q9200_002866 [Gallowayella weberi]